MERRELFSLRKCTFVAFDSTLESQRKDGETDSADWRVPVNIVAFAKHAAAFT